MHADIFFKSFATAVHQGSLGLFIGAGFSKAVMKESGIKAHCFKELLKDQCKRWGIKYKGSNHDYRHIIDALCLKIQKAKSVGETEAILYLKQSVASQVAYMPSQSVVDTYRSLLLSLKPKWIITTNYDFVLEAILGNKCLTIDVDDMFVQYQDLIPIYHVHGTRYNPKGMVLVDGDYLATFRPNDYRMQRLSFLLMECVPMFIGYSLNDMNIRVALDWKENLYSRKIPKNPRLGDTLLNKEIIQCLHDDNASEIDIARISHKSFSLTYSSLENLLHSLSQKAKFYSSVNDTEHFLLQNGIGAESWTKEDVSRLNLKYPLDAAVPYFTMIANGMLEDAIKYLSWYVLDSRKEVISSHNMLIYHIDCCFQMLCSDPPHYSVNRSDSGFLNFPTEYCRGDLPVQVYDILEENFNFLNSTCPDFKDAISTVYQGKSAVIPVNQYTIAYQSEKYQDRFQELIDIAKAKGHEWFIDSSLNVSSGD